MHRRHVSGADHARVRHAARTVGGATRAQAANLVHLARREPVSPPPLRMASVTRDDVAVARRGRRDPGAAEFRGAPDLLERTFGAWSGSGYAVAFATGRVALSACLAALRLTPGDRVVVPAYTCLVVVNALRFAGLEPVYADIEHETYGLDAASAEAALAGGASAVLVQHLYGLVSRDLEAVVDAARRRGVPVIEDCAQSMGARLHGRAVGTFGDLGFHSTGAGKAIEAGLGGIAVTDDPALARRLRRVQEAATEVDAAEASDVLATFLLDHARLAAPGRWWRGPLAEARLGRRRVEAATEEELSGRRPAGYERRMPPAVAALALGQLGRLEGIAALRRESARMWSSALAGTAAAPRVIDGSSPVFTSYPVLVAPAMKRDRRWAYERHGVSLATWFSEPPEAAALAGNPRAAEAYSCCVCFPTSTARARMPAAPAAAPPAPDPELSRC